MSQSDLGVTILHSDNPRDRALARSIEADLGDGVVRVRLMPIGEAVEAYRKVANLPLVRKAAGIIPGILIILLTEALLNEPECRAAVVAADSGKFPVRTRQYFVCVDISPDDARARFPELNAIFENVWLRQESEIPEIVKDIRSGPPPIEPAFSTIIGPGIALIVALVVSLLLSTLSRIYKVRIPIVIAGAILSKYDQRYPKIEISLILAAFYIVGLGLNYIDPLDLWPWLGRRWKPSADMEEKQVARLNALPFGPVVFACLSAGCLVAEATGAKGMMVLGFVVGYGLQSLVNLLRCFQDADKIRQRKVSPSIDLVIEETAAELGLLDSAINARRRVEQLNRAWLFFPILIIACLETNEARHSSMDLGWTPLFAVAGGILTHVALSFAQRAAARLVARTHGLTQGFLKPQSEMLGRVTRRPVSNPLGLSDEELAGLDEQERRDFPQFLLRLRVADGQLLLHWFRKPVSVFISYVLLDEQKNGTAARVDDTFKQIRIQCFRDLRVINDPFENFRRHISVAVSECTHFVLVLSPEIKGGIVVLKEIESALNRWPLEMLPAIILVAESDVVLALLHDPNIPLNVRRLLMSCPRMSISEATDPAQLRYIIETTRRQGKLNDWIMVLSNAA